MSCFRALCFGMMLLMCSGCGGAVFGSVPTRVDSVPVKFGLRDSSVVIGLPVVVEERKTGGVRSLLDMQVYILMTNYEGIGLPIMPSGVVFGLRGRW